MGSTINAASSLSLFSVQAAGQLYVSRTVMKIVGFWPWSFVTGGRRSFPLLTGYGLRHTLARLELEMTRATKLNMLNQKRATKLNMLNEMRATKLNMLNQKRATKLNTLNQTRMTIKI